MLAAIDSAKSRINFETYVFNDGEIGDRFVDALARAAQRGVVVRIVLDPIGSSLECEEHAIAEGGRREARLVQPARLLQPRRVQLPDPSQDAGGRRRRRVHRRHGRRRSLARPRAGQGALARHATSGSPVPPCARSKARSTRTGSKPAACRRRRSIRSCRRAPPARGRWWCGAIRWPARATSSCMYLLAIGAARKTIDIQSPYITLDPSTHWSLDQARERGVQDSHAGRGRHHRRHAGEARQPLRLPAAARQRLSRSSNTSRR